MGITYKAIQWRIGNYVVHKVGNSGRSLSDMGFMELMLRGMESH